MQGLKAVLAAPVESFSPRPDLPHALSVLRGATALEGRSPLRLFAKQGSTLPLALRAVAPRARRALIETPPKQPASLVPREAIAKRPVWSTNSLVCARQANTQHSPNCLALRAPWGPTRRRAGKLHA